MKILLLGGNGQVGWELARTLSVLGELVVTTRAGDGIHLDVAEPDRLRETLDAERPQVVVNAAAYTAVDRAEDEPELAHRVNAAAPAVIGDWAARHGAQVLHYSTDYVFDGAKAGPWQETDAPCPINAYGRSKLAGDEALLESGCRAIILRVSWVYGLRGHNFLRTMRRLMTERDELRIVDDQVGAPTWCRTIAQASAIVLARLTADAGRATALSGVYHLSPQGSTSWHGFATAIRDRLGLECRLQAIPTDDYPTPAARPANSRLDSAKICATFGLEMPPWEAELARCVDGA